MTRDTFKAKGAPATVGSTGGELREQRRRLLEIVAKYVGRTSSIYGRICDEFALSPAIAPGGDGIGDAARLADYPKLLAFCQKHTLESLAPPSCLCCGQTTPSHEAGIRHMELPGVVICAKCRDATRLPAAGNAVDDASRRTLEAVIALCDQIREESRQPLSQVSDTTGCVKSNVRHWLRSPKHFAAALAHAAPQDGEADQPVGDDTIREVLFGALDRDRDDITTLQLAIAAANALYWSRQQLAATIAERNEDMKIAHAMEVALR